MRALEADIAFESAAIRGAGKPVQSRLGSGSSSLTSLGSHVLLEEGCSDTRLPQQGALLP
jgi:hypothetical protein